MSRYREFSLSEVRAQPIAERHSKVSLAEFASPPFPGATVRQLLEGLPRILAAPDLLDVAQAIVAARAANRAVVAAIGGHVIKTGLAPVLADLLRRGLITAIAGNGAVAIHDAEIALYGRTSEDVVAGLRTGDFGMARETAEFYNRGAVEARERGEGIGEALGRRLVEAGAPHASHSLLAAAWQARIPVTIHVGIGTDIVHAHPNADGAALGEASLRDFRILTAEMEGLAGGGVLLNIGSAVLLPEVLLKAIALLRNRHGDRFTQFLGVNLDFVQHYRSNQQVVSRVRSIGGRGIALTGHHEIMIPLLAQAVVEYAGE